MPTRLFERGMACLIALGVVMGMPSLASAQTTQETDAQQYDLSLAKGVIQFDDGRYEEAEPLFRKALEAKPDDPEASYYLGQTLTRTKKHEEAEVIFRRMAERDAASGR